VALFVLKKYDEAIVAVDKAIELNSSSEIAWSNKGAILAELKRFKEAIPCFDKAVDLNPAFDGAKKNRAHAIEALAKKGKDSPKKSSRKPRASSPKRGKGKRRR
jgi:tetratricopeptide (TPR) repeat protein